MSSIKPRVQRLRRFTAPMHLRQKFAHAHVSKELKSKLGVKKRAVQVRKGDIVKVMSGKYKGKGGKVSIVNLKRNILRIEGIVRKNSKGKEKMVPIRISTVYITEFELSDKLRKESLGVTQK
jgi:large subunit ribosomal protein L24